MGKFYWIRQTTSSLSAGSNLCLHFDNGYLASTAMEPLLAFCRESGKAPLAPLRAEWRSWFSRCLARDKTIAWLAHVASCGRSTAGALIASSPVPVSSKLSYNAADARKVLGIMGAAAKCNVLVYDCAGTSLVARTLIQRYVREICDDMCAIHVGTGNKQGEFCLPGAVCVAVDGQVIPRGS